MRQTWKMWSFFRKFCPIKLEERNGSVLPLSEDGIKRMSIGQETKKILFGLKEIHILHSLMSPFKTISDVLLRTEVECVHVFTAWKPGFSQSCNQLGSLIRQKGRKKFCFPHDVTNGCRLKSTPQRRKVSGDARTVGHWHSDL